MEYSFRELDWIGRWGSFDFSSFSEMFQFMMPPSKKSDLYGGTMPEIMINKAVNEWQYERKQDKYIVSHPMSGNVLTTGEKDFSPYEKDSLRKKKQFIIKERDSIWIIH